MTTAALRIERIDVGHVRVAGRLGFAEAADALSRSGDLLDAHRRAVAVGQTGR